MGYLRETAKGVSWMGGLRASTRVLAIIKIAILARLLAPEQFGLFGIASLVLVFLEVVTQTGINVFFIQGEGKLKNYINTAWVVSIVRGLVISLLIFTVAPGIATFFNSPDSIYLLYLIGIVPAIKGFINPAIIRYQKELQFNKEFMLRFSIFTFDAIVAITLAYVTKNPSSLIWGLIAGAFLEAILSHLLVKPRPRFSFELEKTKKIIKRGKWITLAGIFEYFFIQGDDIVVGRLLETRMLGLYQVAYRISTIPITETGMILSRVTFPVFSKFSEDARRLRRAFIRTTAVLFIFVVPFGLVLFFFSEEIILIVLGSDWLETAPVLKVLAAFGVIKAIKDSSYSLFKAVKKQEYITTITLVSIVGMAIFIIPFVNKAGILGAAYAATIGLLLSLPLVVYYVARVLRVK